MVSHLIRNGRFVSALSWAKAAARRLKKRENLTLDAASEQVAFSLGFGPRGWQWLQQELPDKASSSSPPASNGFSLLSFDRSNPALYDGVANSRNRTTAASALSKIQVGDWLKPVAVESELKWYELTPESVSPSGNAARIIESIGFDIWPTTPETVEFFFRWHPYEVREAVSHRRDEKLWIVPDGSALNAIDSVFFRLRIPRPWRVTDYHGETENDALRELRLERGLEWGATDRHGPLFDRSQAHPVFESIVRRIGVRSDTFGQMAAANDDLMDTVYLSRSEDVLDDPGVTDSFARVIALIAELNEAVERFDHSFSEKDAAALPLIESLRYVVWQLRTIGSIGSALDSDDILHITMEAQLFLRQLAAPFDSTYTAEAHEFQWPPNAISAPGQTEGGALAQFASRKPPRTKKGVVR